MTPTRAALGIPAAVLVLSGCGLATAHAPKTTTVSISLPASAPAIAPEHLTRPLKMITPAPTYLVATVGTGSTSEWLEIMTPSGAVVARTRINPTQTWMTAAGAGGAYWTANGAEYELSVSGTVRKLGLVPSDAGGVLIGPDGSSYAYATSDPLKDGSFVNKITVVDPGVPAKVIGDRISAVTDDYQWSYYMVSWTDVGIAFARVPIGGCGCRSFDMQMQSAYSAIIDPVSLGETTVTASTSCPLSDIGPDLEAVCFDGPYETDAIRFSSGGTVIHNYVLSGKNFAGDALFSDDASQLAYITIPVTEDQCQGAGGPITATLRIMNVATGTTVSRAMGDFVPSAWSGGVIFGSVTSASGANSWLVGVNPNTMSVTRLTPNGSNVGIIGIL
ncbi:MAG: hypothetical protein WAL84_11970 [Candidatus Dormiibacterota bacterium]